jgi:hypothetical protein
MLSHIKKCTEFRNVTCVTDSIRSIFGWTVLQHYQLSGSTVMKRTGSSEAVALF